MIGDDDFMGVSSEVLNNMFGFGKHVVGMNDPIGFKEAVVKTGSKFTWRKGRYTDIRPRIKSRSKLFTHLRELLRTRGHWTIACIVYKLNEVLRGWLHYFVIAGVSYVADTAQIIVHHLAYKLYKWLKGKGMASASKSPTFHVLNVRSHLKKTRV